MRTGPVILAVAVLLALAGCVPSDPHPSRAPSASATPVFATDAEALAAAEKAYAAYLKVSDEIANDGGKDPGRIGSVARGQLAEDDLDGYKTFRDEKWHSTGGSEISGFKLQSADLLSRQSSPSAVVAYVCEDISGVDVLGDDGVSVVSSNRPDLQTFEVVFDLVKTRLLPSDRQVWTGPSPCA